jgi:DNA-binding MarR family transcriptional regulator
MRIALEPHGLTHVQFVLLASTWWLGEHGEQPSQRRVAEHAGTDAMMTSQVLRTLEAGGLVRRVRDPSDTRVRRLVITDAGRGRLSAALADVEQADRAFFGPLADRRVVGWLRKLARPDPAGRDRAGYEKA